LKHVDLYTDGACLGNPGPGGYGVLLAFNGNEKELSAGFRLTTNNRMELLATSIGLEALKEPCEVDLYSDSRYVVDGIEKGWARSWKANGWRKRDKQPALNPRSAPSRCGFIAAPKMTAFWKSRGRADSAGRGCRNCASKRSRKARC
jgi:ribonuclease HI